MEEFARSKAVPISWEKNSRVRTDEEFEAAKNDSIYKSIPVQIGNKSNKFQYSKIEKNARKRDYESSLDWLLSSNMIYKCCKLNSINIPPEAYKNNDYFKIYMGDIGILNTMLKINTNEINKQIFRIV